MMSKRNYYKLLQQSPRVKCPEEVSRRVLAECQIEARKRPARLRPNFPFPYVMDWIGCLTMVAIIVGLIIGQAGFPTECQNRIAVNGMAFVNQIIAGLDGTVIGR